MSSNHDHNEAARRESEALTKAVKALSNSQRDALVAVLTVKQHEMIGMLVQHADNPGAVQAFASVLTSLNALTGMALSTSIVKRGKNPSTRDPAVLAVLEGLQNMLSLMAEQMDPNAKAREAELEVEFQALIESGVEPKEALSQMIRKADSPEYAAAQAQVEAHRSSAGDGLDGLYL